MTVACIYYMKFHFVNITTTVILDSTWLPVLCKLKLVGRQMDMKRHTYKTALTLLYLIVSKTKDSPVAEISDKQWLFTKSVKMTACAKVKYKGVF